MSAEQPPGSSADEGHAEHRDPLGEITRTQRYGALLVAIALAFAIEGIASAERWEQVVVSLLLGATVMLSLWAASAKRRVIQVVGIIVVATVTVAIVEAAQGNVDLAAARIANTLLVMLAPPAIVVGVIRDLRRRQAVTPQTVLGVLCLYLLIGLFFAALFGSIERVTHEPFFSEYKHAHATLSETLYFSFTTLTTVGYGDFTARTNLGHTLSVSEALIGQIYLVTVVALIVGNLGRKRLTPS
jgi:hypothetical protein